MKSGVGLVVLFVAFLVLAVLISLDFKGDRLDLTENHLYTLSKGSKSILDDLKTPITLTLYFSNQTSTNLPALRSYEARVRELLDEYQANSRGLIHFHVVDPEPFSDQEDTATEAGLQSIPKGNQGDKVFFGLIGRNQAGDQQVIPFFRIDRETSLEYDITKLIYTLENPQEPVVAVISGLDVNGGVDFATHSRKYPWAAIQQMEGLFDVHWLGDDVAKIGKNVDVLLLIHPTDLSDQTRFAIDQYVLNGGKLIAFFDPNSEAAGDNSGMAAAPQRRSDLPELLKHWGVQLSQDFVGDYDNSLVVGVGPQRQPMRHIGLLGLTREDFANGDVILSGLDNINLSTTGYFKILPGTGLKVQPLLYSSRSSMPIDTHKLLTLQTPDQLMDGFRPTGKRYVLAARITGKATTAFPNGVNVKVPAPADKSPSTDKSGNAPGATRMVEEHLSPTRTSGDINLMVVGDTDVLSDRLWVRINDFFGQRVAQPWADNGSFLINALDNFAGSKDLISIRSRGRYTRPFVKVEALRRDAESRFLEREEALKDKLKQTEDKLDALQKKAGKGNKNLLTQEQKSTILQFREEKLKIRKQLRDVQHQLNSDIEALGAKLKLINIVIAPLLLTLLLALITWWWRRSFRR